MGILFNRYLAIHFLDKGAVIGGRQEVVNGQVIYPPTINFALEATSDPEPNEGEFSVYNMAPQTQRDLLIEGERVEIEAGYWPQGGTRDTDFIFKGKITTAATRYGGASSISRVMVADSEDEYAHTRVRQVFEGKSHADIAQAIAEAFKARGLEIGRIDVPEFVEDRPRTVDRLARLELDDICYQHDLQWSIQQGVLNVWPRDEPLENGRRILTPGTGVIGVPEFSDKGVDFETLMIPSLSAGEIFELRNDNLTNRVSEICKIEDIEFRGGNRGRTFGAKIKSKFLQSDKVVRARQQFIGAKT